MDDEDALLAIIIAAMFRGEDADATLKIVEKLCRFYNKTLVEWANEEAE